MDIISSTSAGPRDHRGIGFVYALFLFLLLTNHTYSFRQSIAECGQTDIQKYRRIALGTMADLPKVGIDAAHKFVIPYSLGRIYKYAGLDLEALFYVSVLICLVTTIALVHRMLCILGVSSIAAALSEALLIFNPYFFRYYLAHPGMVTDAAFVLGTALVLCGLIEKRPAALVIGLLLASVARQSGFLLIPPSLAWLYWGRAWKDCPKVSKALFAAALIAIPVATFSALAYLACEDPMGMSYLESRRWLIPWMLNSFSWAPFISLFLRMIFPFLLSLTFIAGILSRGDLSKKKWPVEFKLCLLTFLCIYAQSLKTDPDTVGGNPMRYSWHGMVPFILCVAMVLNACLRGKNISGRILVAACLLIFAGSLNHQTSFLQILGASKEVFFVLYISSSIALFILMHSYRSDRGR